MIGLTKEQIEKGLEDMGIKAGQSINADLIRKAIAEVVTTNNNIIEKQVQEAFKDHNGHLHR